MSSDTAECGVHHAEPEDVLATAIVVERDAPSYSAIDQTIGDLLSSLADVHTPAPWKKKTAVGSAMDVATPATSISEQRVALQAQELQMQIERLTSSRDELARQQGEARGTIAKLQGAVTASDKRLKQQQQEIEALKVCSTCCINVIYGGIALAVLH